MNIHEAYAIVIELAQQAALTPEHVADSGNDPALVEQCCRQAEAIDMLTEAGARL